MANKASRGVEDNVASVIAKGYIKGGESIPVPQSMVLQKVAGGSTFAGDEYPAGLYAQARPTYSQELYDYIMKWHAGKTDVCLDVGTGPGLVARAMGRYFAAVKGIDPGEGMLAEAARINQKSGVKNVEYEQASAEDMPNIKDHSVDAIVSAQAAHWFRHGEAGQEFARVLRRDGTLAIWVYEGLVVQNCPEATRVMRDYADSKGKLGPYWEQPGRSVLRSKMRSIEFSSDLWKDVQRLEYQPSSPTLGAGAPRIVHYRVPISMLMQYFRTWSAFRRWQDVHPEATGRSKGGPDDLADHLFDDLMQEVPAWRQVEDPMAVVVEIDWEGVLILARKR